MTCSCMHLNTDCSILAANALICEGCQHCKFGHWLGLCYYIIYLGIYAK